MSENESVSGMGVAMVDDDELDCETCKYVDLSEEEEPCSVCCCLDMWEAADDDDGPSRMDHEEEPPRLCLDALDPLDDERNCCGGGCNRGHSDEAEKKRRHHKLRAYLVESLPGETTVARLLEIERAIGDLIEDEWRR